MTPRSAAAVTESLRAASRAADLDPARRLAAKIPMTRQAVTLRLRLQSRLRDACLRWRSIGQSAGLSRDPKAPASD